MESGFEQKVVNRHRRPLPEFFPRWLAQSVVGDSAVRCVFWRPEQDIFNAGMLVQPAEGTFEALVVALFDRGTMEWNERHGWLAQRLFDDGPANLRTLPEYLLPGLVAQMDWSELQPLVEARLVVGAP